MFSLTHSGIWLEKFAVGSVIVFMHSQVSLVVNQFIYFPVSIMTTIEVKIISTTIVLQMRVGKATPALQPSCWNVAK